MARRTSLVCQHLENISRDALEEYQDIIRDYVRRRQGVYALYRGGKLYYVGLANNLRSRLSHHLKNRHKDSWDRFSVYLTIGDSHLRELESLILRIVMPPGNKQKGKFAKSEELRRRFSKDIRRLQRDQLTSLLGRRFPVQDEGSTDSDKGKKPILAAYIGRPMNLRARYKGRRIVAKVRRDGSIRYSGRLYNSPSHAAYAVLKRPVNGWIFWEYERAPGDWVVLDELRK